LKVEQLDVMWLPGHNDVLTTFLSFIFYLKLDSPFFGPLFSTFGNLVLYLLSLKS